MVSLALARERLTASRLTIAFCITLLVHALVQVSLEARAYRISLDGIDLWTAALAPQPPTVVQEATPTQVVATTAPTQPVIAQQRLPGSLTLTTDAAPAPALSSATAEVEESSGDEGEDESAESSDDDDEVEDAATASRRVRMVRRRRAHRLHARKIVKRQILPASTQCRSEIETELATVERTERQDVAYIALQLWLVGLGLSAVILQSTSHLAALVISKILTVVLAATQISQIPSLQHRIDHVLAEICGGADFIASDQWAAHLALDGAALGIELAHLLAIALFIWFLRRRFAWVTFKQVGASVKAAHAHRLEMIFRVMLQMAVFFIVVFNALWLRELTCIDSPDYSAERTRGYQVFLGILTVSVLPWIALGWRAVDRGSHKLMAGFLILSLVFVGNMLFLIADPSALLKEASAEWPFLRFLGVMASVLLVSLFALGLACLSIWYRPRRATFTRGITNRDAIFLDLDDDKSLFGNEKIDPYVLETVDLGCADDTSILPPTYAMPEQSMSTNAPANTPLPATVKKQRLHIPSPIKISRWSSSTRLTSSTSSVTGGEQYATAMTLPVPPMPARQGVSRWSRSTAATALSGATRH